MQDLDEQAQSATMMDAPQQEHGQTLLHEARQCMQ